MALKKKRNSLNTVSAQNEQSETRGGKKKSQSKFRFDSYLIKTRHADVKVNTELTWLDGVLDADHGGPVPAAHALQHLVLGQVGASVLHPDARLHVIEVAAIQLKEFDEEEAQVDVGAPRVDPRMQLSPARREVGVKKCTPNKNPVS